MQAFIKSNSEKIILKNNIFAKEDEVKAGLEEF